MPRQRRTSTKKKGILATLTEAAQSGNAFAQRMLSRKQEEPDFTIDDALREALGMRGDRTVAYLAEALIESGVAERLVEDYAEGANTGKPERFMTPGDFRSRVLKSNKVRRLDILSDIYGIPITADKDGVTIFEPMLDDMKSQVKAQWKEDHIYDEADFTRPEVQSELEEHAKAKLVYGLQEGNLMSVLDEIDGDEALADLPFPRWFTADDRNNAYGQVCEILEGVYKQIKDISSAVTERRAARDRQIRNLRREKAIQAQNYLMAQARFDGNAGTAMELVAPAIRGLIEARGGSGARGTLEAAIEGFNEGEDTKYIAASTEEEVREAAVGPKLSQADVTALVPVEQVTRGEVVAFQQAHEDAVHALTVMRQSGQLDDVVTLFMESLAAEEAYVNADRKVEDKKFILDAKVKLKDLAYDKLNAHRKQLEYLATKDACADMSVAEAWSRYGIAWAAYTAAHHTMIAPSQRLADKVSGPMLALGTAAAMFVAGAVNPMDWDALKVSYTPFKRAESGELLRDPKSKEYKLGETKPYSLAELAPIAGSDAWDQYQGNFQDLRDQQDAIAKEQKEATRKAKSQIDKVSRNQANLYDQLERLVPTPSGGEESF